MLTVSLGRNLAYTLSKKSSNLNEDVVNIRGVKVQKPNNKFSLHILENKPSRS